VRKVMNRLAVMSLIGLPVLGMAVPAGAATRVATVRVVSIRPAVSPQTKVPKSKIVGNTSAAVYKPAALSAAEDTSGGNCSDTFVSFEIINTGTATEYVTIDGSTFFTLTAGSEASLCTEGGAAGDQQTYGLSNKKDTKNYKATLLVTYTS